MDVPQIGNLLILDQVLIGPWPKILILSCLLIGQLDVAVSFVNERHFATSLLLLKKIKNL